MSDSWDFSDPARPHKHAYLMADMRWQNDKRPSQRPGRS
jgi:hypothetical protein